MNIICNNLNRRPTNKINDAKLVYKEIGKNLQSNIKIFDSLLTLILYSSSRSR